MLAVVSLLGAQFTSAQGLYDRGPLDEATLDGSELVGEEVPPLDPPPEVVLGQAPLVPGPVDESLTDPIEPTQPPPVEPVPDPVVIEEPPSVEQLAPPPEPTTVPEPTMVPTPTSAPTAVPTPTPAPTPPPAPTPTPTLAPTPTPTPTSRIAPASVSPGTGAITGCSHAGQSDQIRPGNTLAATCILNRSATNENSARFQIAEPTSTVAGSAAGWQVMVSSGSTSTGWVSVGSQITVPFSAQSVAFSFALRAPANAVANGATISTTVTAVACQGSNCSTNRGSTTLSASVASPGAGDMSLTCSPASPLSVPRVGSGTVTCRLNALSGLGTLSLIVRSVTISAPPAGWTMATYPAGTTGAGGAVTISPNLTLAAGSSWSFTVTLTPSCTALAAGSWNISSQVASTNGTLTGANVAGPTATYAASATSATQDVSVSVVSSSLQWSTPYSYDSRSFGGDLTYRVTGSGCLGWNVSISARPFHYSGPGQGRAISANNLDLATPGEPTVISGSGSGVSAVALGGSLGSTRKVLQAQAGSGNGTYEHTLSLTLAIPENAVVGSYSSTITLTTAAGP